MNEEARKFLTSLLMEYGGELPPDSNSVNYMYSEGELKAIVQDLCEAYDIYTDDGGWN